VPTIAIAVWHRPIRRALSIGCPLGLAFVLTAAAHAGNRVGLRTFDWNRAVLPGSVCGADHPIELHTGSATIRSDRWPTIAQVSVDRGRVVYGDVNGNGRDAAALQVVCANLGGTAGGQLSFAVVVYSPDGRAPVAIGVLTPVIRSVGHVPILLPTSIEHDEVTVTEYSYGPNDPDCCPTGRAITVWKLEHGTFRPASTHVIKRPTA
jgi:hypothetical protein